MATEETKMSAQFKELLTVSAAVAACITVGAAAAAWGEQLSIPSWGWALVGATTGGVGAWFSVKAILANTP